MKFNITRGGTHSFTFVSDKSFTINIGINDDIIDVFQWAIEEFKKIK